MGATHATVTIPDPAEPHRAWEGLFLLEAIGLIAISG